MEKCRVETVHNNRNKTNNNKTWLDVQCRWGESKDAKDAVLGASLPSIASKVRSREAEVKAGQLLSGVVPIQQRFESALPRGPLWVLWCKRFQVASESSPVESHVKKIIESYGCRASCRLQVVHLHQLLEVISICCRLYTYFPDLLSLHESRTIIIADKDRV